MQRFTLHDRRRGQVPAQVEPGQLRFQPTDRSRRAATTEGLPLPLWIACRAYHSRSAGTSARRGDHCYAPRQLGSNLLHKFLGGPSRRRKAGCPREALGVLSPTHLTRSRTGTAGTDQFASSRPMIPLKFSSQQLVWGPASTTIWGPIGVQSPEPFFRTFSVAYNSEILKLGEARATESAGANPVIIE